VYVAQPLDPAKPQGLIVRVSYPRRVWTQLPVSGWAIVLSATLSAGLLMTWLGILLHRRWIGPVQTLSHRGGGDGARAVGHARRAGRGDEIRAFSASLNHLAGRPRSSSATWTRGEASCRRSWTRSPIRSC
jgi:hypothetical protein